EEVFDTPAGPQLHRPRREPFASHLRVGEVAPDAFGRSRQQALDAHSARFGDDAVRSMDIHDLFPFFFASAFASDCVFAASRSSATRRASRTSSCWFQNFS